MGKYCCIMKCNSRSHDWRGKKVDNGGLRFFKFPTWKQSADKRVFEVTKRRRMAWIAAVRRETITFDNIAPHMVVCSRHFLEGKLQFKQSLSVFSIGSLWRRLHVKLQLLYKAIYWTKSIQHARLLQGLYWFGIYFPFQEIPY